MSAETLAFLLLALSASVKAWVPQPQQAAPITATPARQKRQTDLLKVTVNTFWKYDWQKITTNKLKLNTMFDAYFANKGLWHAKADVVGTENNGGLSYIYTTYYAGDCAWILEMLREAKERIGSGIIKSFEVKCGGISIII
ncbi:unnamed protein product [Strongylus vulgaris]|uniref:Uncharacterized protein n=1 Tax=Strongylus vulgaris TaxID=40348 RepID=A0A3P7IIU5_STRVU|nr:unnamed protein product [Strongylus vulgaris]